MNKDTDGDSWGQLLSDFGIEDSKVKETAQAEEPKTEDPAEVAKTFVKNEGTVEHRESSPEESDNDGFGAGLLDSPAEVTDEHVKTREKKSIFSRFPKVNFFGAPPQVSLDSVIESAKSPSLGGRGFTDNKLEKMPLSKERTNRQKKKIEEESNTWSVVASQIETLASGKESSSTTDERSSKRRISSMFDEPIPESDESRALKDLMGTPAPQERKNSNGFLEEESDSRRRERGRGRRQPAASDKSDSRGRGVIYEPPVEADDISESDFEPLDHETPAFRGRGRRNNSRYSRRESRYDQETIHDSEPMEEWSEVDAALQSGQDNPRQHGGRYRQDRDRKPERSRKPAALEREQSIEEEDNSVIAAYGNIPDWDEAIGDIVAGNIARHKGSSHRGRR